jgi:protein phosphatase
VLSAIGTRADLRVYHHAPPLPVDAGDRFLLCSDGLHDVLDDDELRAAMLGPSPETACRALIALALERGAPDNVTALVAHVAVAPVGAHATVAGGSATRPVPPTREAPAIEGASR